MYIIYYITSCSRWYIKLGITVDVKLQGIHALISIYLVHTE